MRQLDLYVSLAFCPEADLGNSSEAMLVDNQSVELLAPGFVYYISAAVSVRDEMSDQ